MIKAKSSNVGEKFYLYIGEKKKLELDYSDFSVSLIKAMVPSEPALIASTVIQMENRPKNKKFSFEKSRPNNITNIFNKKISSELTVLFKDIKTREEENKPVDKLAFAKEYCKNTVYPVFIKIRSELSLHEREANVHIDLGLLLIALEVRYGRQVEYDYIIQIKNPLENPTLFVKSSTIGNGAASRNNSLYNSIAPRNTINREIKNVTREDILEDFLNSYHTFLKVKCHKNLK
jgi:hypothetical protein